MQRILRFVEGEIRGLHEAAYLLGFFALLSTLLALFRDRLLASTFGASEMLDIYYAAFRIPDIVFVSIASLVSVFILVPLLTQYSDKEKRSEIIGGVIASFSVLMLVSTVLLWIFMPHLLRTFFSALLLENDVLITMSRILLIQPFFLGLSGILASVTQISGRYIIYAIAPLLYNISIIFGILALYPIFGLLGIAYGVVIGAFLHMGIQIPFSVRVGYLQPKTFKVRLAEMWDIISVSIPRTFSITANQLALLILVIISATLGVGSVSVFSLAFNLQAAPLAIIGASYSVAAFPTLARFLSRGEISHFFDQMVTASRHVIFWSVPLTALVIVLRAHIVRVVLGSGEFDWSDTRLTAAALALFIVSLTAQALSLLFIRGYYAAGETLKPLLVNVATAVGIVVGAYTLLWMFAQNELWRYFIEHLLRVEDIIGTEVLMLPLSYALFSILNIVVFFFLFERDFGSLREHMRKPIFESFSAAVVAAFAAHQTLDALDGVFNIDTFLGVFLIGFIGGIVGIVAGAIVLRALGNREIQEVWVAWHTKFWQYVPILPTGTERGTDI